MWPAMVIALLVGILIGYFAVKAFLVKPSPLVEELDQLTDKVGTLEDKIKELEQHKADLSYQLGEEQKARAYYQKKAESAE